MQVRWMTAFLDTPRGAPGAAEALELWQQATGTRLSPRRGEEQEFATLLPSEGDAFLRVQDVGTEQHGCHLDLHVDDVRAAADEALASGALLVDDQGSLVLGRSPGGLPFCLVEHGGEVRRPSPLAVPRPEGGGTFSSLVDQLSIDVPARTFGSEADWWSRLTGWSLHQGARPEFMYLGRPAGLPLRLLFQRLPESDAASAHLDLACTDRPAEVARHLGLGATHLRHTERWDTLLDPVGRAYCVTDRDPVSGTLSEQRGEPRPGCGTTRPPRAPASDG